MAELQGSEAGEARLELFTRDDSDMRGREVGRAGLLVLLLL